MSTHESQRRTIRLRDFDYRQPGFYYITICVEKHTIMFGHIVNDSMHLNHNGLVAKQVWNALPQRFPGIELDQYVIMPNHMHGIIALKDEQPLLYHKVNTDRVPERFKATVQQAGRTYKQMPGLGQIIRSFKAEVTYRIHRTGSPDFTWQKRYYESILTSEKALEFTRLYIVNNPARWALDKLYQENLSTS
jgi:putative transposase